MCRCVIVSLNVWESRSRCLWVDSGHTSHKYHNDTGPLKHNFCCKVVLAFYSFIKEPHDLLDGRHAENNMPKLFDQPAKAVIIRDICGRNPVQDADIVLQGPLLNTFTTDRKLGTALMPDVIWSLTWRDSKKIPEDLRELINHVLIVFVDSDREGLMHGTWAPWSVRTP